MVVFLKTYKKSTPSLAVRVFLAVLLSVFVVVVAWVISNKPDVSRTRANIETHKSTPTLKVETIQPTINSVSQANQPVQASLSPQNLDTQALQETQNALQPTSFRADQTTY